MKSDRLRGRAEVLQRGFGGVCLARPLVGFFHAFGVEGCWDFYVSPAVD